MIIRPATGSNGRGRFSSYLTAVPKNPFIRQLVSNVTKITTRTMNEINTSLVFKRKRISMKIKFIFITWFFAFCTTVSRICSLLIYSFPFAICSSLNLQYILYCQRILWFYGQTKRIFSLNYSMISLDVTYLFTDVPKKGSWII